MRLREQGVRLATCMPAGTLMRTLKARNTPISASVLTPRFQEWNNRGINSRAFSSVIVLTNPPMACDAGIFLALGFRGGRMWVTAKPLHISRQAPEFASCGSREKLATSNSPRAEQLPHLQILHDYVPVASGDAGVEVVGGIRRALCTESSR